MELLGFCRGGENLHGIIETVLCIRHRREGGWKKVPEVRTCSHMDGIFEQILPIARLDAHVVAIIAPLVLQICP